MCKGTELTVSADERGEKAADKNYRGPGGPVGCPRPESFAYIFGLSQ